MGRKFGGSALFLGEGELGLHQARCGLDRAHLHAKCHLDPSSRLATIDMGRKLGGGSAPILRRGAGSPSNTKSPGPRRTSIPSGILIHPAIWQQQIWAENWRLCPFEGGGARFPSNTILPWPRPTCMPSFILIHTTVLATIHQRYRQDIQTDRQWFDSIGEPRYKRSPKKPTVNLICSASCWLSALTV